MVHRPSSRKGFRAARLEAADGVPAEFIAAAKTASQELTRLGVRHVLVGGLAVGAHGYARGTKDVDFMVGDEGFEHHGEIVVPKALPLRIGNVPIDWVSLEADDRDILERFLILPTTAEVPIIPIEGLVFMKLLAGRARDHADVVELLKAGVSAETIRTFLTQFAAEMLVRFSDLERQAAAEAP